MLQNNHATTCPHCGMHLQTAIPQHKDKLHGDASGMIARHLAFSLQINQGAELVVLLGIGNEKDNIEAVTSWVLGRIERLPKWPLSGDEAILFIEQLEKELRSILQDASMGWM